MASRPKQENQEFDESEFADLDSDIEPVTYNEEDCMYSGMDYPTEESDRPIKKRTADAFVMRKIKHNLLDQQEETAVFISYSTTKDPAEKRRLANYIVSKNLRMVSKIAFQYYYRMEASVRYRNMDLSDLHQEGNIGLFRAVNKFDPKKGFKFSTYAWYWVHEAISRAIKNKNSQVRIPIHVLEEIVPVQKAWAAGMAEGKILSSADLAEQCNISIDEVQEYWSYLQDHYSLDASPEDGGVSLLDTIWADSDRFNIKNVKSLTKQEDLIAREEDRQKLLKALRLLNKFDSEFIKRRFGFRDSEGRTRHQMAEIYKMSEQKVAQTERRILEELRKILVDEKFNLFNHDFS